MERSSQKENGRINSVLMWWEVIRTNRSSGFVCLIDQTYFRHSDHQFNISNIGFSLFPTATTHSQNDGYAALLIQTASPKMMWRVTIASRRHIPLFPDRTQPEFAVPGAGNRKISEFSGFPGDPSKKSSLYDF